MERRLAAILAADVVGYSRLIRSDEEGTVVALQALHADLIDPKISQHHGRIVKLMGDGMLAEFPSVVDAVRAAVETQEALVEHNSRLPEDKRLEFRVGINLGDVIIDGDDIQGDGVNVAARLEGLAQPGGICISGSVHEQVRDRLDLPFEDMGEKEVKNIARPVRVWQWTLVTAATTNPTPGEPPLPLPDKPSIAVLPFENMSGDAEQDYFVDGMVEDILTTLSKVPDLFVIARNSSFTYKGQAVDVRQVGRELGVRHVVEGSVRKAGNRVRVTAQLVECSSGGHLWADRFDGELDDVFELQDNITQEIVTALEVSLTVGEKARIWRVRSGSPEVYEDFQKALELYTQFAKESHRQVLQILVNILEKNPDYPAAHYLHGLTLVDQARFNWAESRDTTYVAALEAADRALAMALSG